MRKHLTTAAPEAGDFSHTVPEFGRATDVQRHFGIKRGTLYNLMADGKIKGILLRVRGAKSGVRLFHMESIRRLILDSAEVVNIDSESQKAA